MIILACTDLGHANRVKRYVIMTKSRDK